jgi:hypothetical protein
VREFAVKIRMMAFKFNFPFTLKITKKCIFLINEILLPPRWREEFPEKKKCYMNLSAISILALILYRRS